MAARAADLLEVEYYAHAEAMASSSSRILEKREFPADELPIVSDALELESGSVQVIVDESFGI